MSFYHRRGNARMVSAIALGVLLICGVAIGSLVPSLYAATTTVDIVNFAFVPQTITVAVGDTVTWTNKDGAAHTATDLARPPTFDTGILGTNNSGSVQFNTTGTFPYVCNLHPGMSGTVVVQATSFTDAVFLPLIQR